MVNLVMELCQPHSGQVPYSGCVKCWSSYTCVLVYAAVGGQERIPLRLVVRSTHGGARQSRQVAGAAPQVMPRYYRQWQGVAPRYRQ